MPLQYVSKKNFYVVLDWLNIIIVLIFHVLYIMQYTRPTKTKNCFILINNRSVRGRPSTDVAKIEKFFYIHFDGRQYPFAVVFKYEKAREDEYLNFDVVKPAPSNDFLILPLTRIVQKVVILEFTDVLDSFQSRVTLALRNYK